MQYWVLLSLLIPLLFGVQTVYGATWYDTDWTYSKRITIDSTDFDSNLTDFILLVNITDSNLASNALANGDDILFTSLDNETKIDHELEDYGSGWLTAWLRVNVTSATDTNIIMYYGNAGASNQEDITGTWKNFESVHHLNDDFLDSTGNHDGSNVGSSDVACSIRDCQSFDGINDRIDLANIYDFAGDTQLTITSWINSVSKGNADEETIFSNYDATTQAEVIFRLDGGSAGNNVEVFIVLETDSLGFNDGASVSTGVYSLAGMTVNVPTTQDQCNWLQDSKSCIDYFSSTIDNDVTTNPSEIGFRGGSADYFKGKIDEVQVYKGLLSDDYLESKYDCENPTAFDSANKWSGCISLGIQDEAPSTGSTVTVSDENAHEETISVMMQYNRNNSDENAHEESLMFSLSGTELLTDDNAHEEEISAMVNDLNQHLIDDNAHEEDLQVNCNGSCGAGRNAIILSLNPPTLSRLGGVFGGMCDFANNYTMVGIWTNGSIRCEQLP